MNEYVEELLMEMRKPSDSHDVKNKKLLGETEAFGRLMDYLAEHGEEREAVLSVLCEQLESMDVYKACCISHFCGYLIENIGLGEVGEQLVDFYAGIIKLACEYPVYAARQLGLETGDYDTEMEDRLDWERLFGEAPDQVRAYCGCDMATLAVMDVITRSPSCRSRLREYGLYDQMDMLQSYVRQVFYPIQVLDACAHLPLVVLAPEVERGFLAEVNDVCNNFSVMTLQEAELCRKQWEGRFGMEDYRFDSGIYDLVTGAAYPKEEGSVVLHMHYTYWNGTLLWGEMPPESVPVTDGRAIIMMGKKGMMNRTFDTRFLMRWHEALNPYFKIERELEQEEVREWLDQIEAMKKGGV